jgi:XTP/dITP diphosphohydrolase
MNGEVANEAGGRQAIRKLAPGRIVIASHNPGKVREIAELLAPYGIEPVSAAELDLPEPEETGTTFIANAELKALQAADLSGLPALADDSGLSSIRSAAIPASSRRAGPGNPRTSAMPCVWSRTG